MTSAPTVTPEPAVAVRPAHGTTRGVALVLPGGRADSFDLTDARHLAGVRMLPFARSLHRVGAGSGLAVWSVRYRYRGWNGADMSPVADAIWALGEVRRTCGDVPVVLVGHSMGGRTAVRVAGDPAVAGVVALAPWLPDGEPVEQLRGRRLLVAHGVLDRVTSPRASRRYVDRARTVAAEVAYVSVRGEMHAMVLRPRTWHRLSTDCVLDLLGLRPLTGRTARAVARGVI